MKDKTVRERVDAIQDQLKVRWCDSCNRFTLQHQTIYCPPTKALAIPDTVGKRGTVCGHDIIVWFCLSCGTAPEIEKLFP